MVVGWLIVMRIKGRVGWVIGGDDGYGEEVKSCM